MSRRPFTRRRFLGTTAAASAATIGFPYIRTSHAAGSLALGFWDHWVPGANDTLTKLCQDWGKKEKVDVKIDYITSQGNKNMLTITAEAQARSGHDILAHPAWYALTYARQLEPLDDVMNPLIKQHGKVAEAAEFLCKSGRIVVRGKRWIATDLVMGRQGVVIEMSDAPKYLVVKVNEETYGTLFVVVPIAGTAQHWYRFARLSR